MTIMPKQPAPPSRRDAAMAAEASRALSPFGHVLELRLQLGDGGVLLLPRPAVDLLRRALAEIAQGHAVTVTAVDAELTTQEAANHLKVSRPHLIRLLEEEDPLPPRRHPPPRPLRRPRGVPGEGRGGTPPSHGRACRAGAEAGERVLAPTER